MDLLTEQEIQERNKIRKQYQILNNITDQLRRMKKRIDWNFKYIGYDNQNKIIELIDKLLNIMEEMDVKLININNK